MDPFSRRAQRGGEPLLAYACERGFFEAVAGVFVDPRASDLSVRANLDANADDEILIGQ